MTVVGDADFRRLLNWYFYGPGGIHDTQPSIKVLNIPQYKSRQAIVIITFSARRSQGEMYTGHGRLCVCLSVCLLAHIFCGQMAGWIMMPLGMEIGLGPGDFVLDGNQAPFPKKGVEPFSHFRPMSIVAKRLDGSRWHLARRWALVQATLC